MPATLIISRVVRPGKLEQFRAWATELDRAAAAAPGHAGSVRLEQADGFHHLLHRFASEGDLARWRATPAYEELMQAGDTHSVGEAQAKAGEQIGFTLPSEASAHEWRMLVVTLAAVFPVLLLVSTLVRKLFPDLPPIAQTAISSPILTGVLTYFILPSVNRWSRFWQVQDVRGNVRSSGDRG